MPLATQQPLLADTSPFCRFAESGICEVLVDYLDDRLHLTTWVIAELEHRARLPAHASLRTLEEREPPWVQNPAVALTDAELKRADVLATGWSSLQQRRSGVQRDPRANLGEATTLVAAERNKWGVILDEGKARTYAVGRGLVVLSTQDLVVEMASAGILTEKRALLIYKRVYRDASPEQFDAAVQAARTEVAGT